MTATAVGKVKWRPHHTDQQALGAQLLLHEPQEQELLHEPQQKSLPTAFFFTPLVAELH